MKALFTVLVRTGSEGRGVVEGAKEKPGEEGWRGEDGRSEEWRMWIMFGEWRERK